MKQISAGTIFNRIMCFLGVLAGVILILIGMALLLAAWSSIPSAFPVPGYLLAPAFIIGGAVVFAGFWVIGNAFNRLDQKKEN